MQRQWPCARNRLHHLDEAFKVKGGCLCHIPTTSGHPNSFYSATYGEGEFCANNPQLSHPRTIWGCDCKDCREWRRKQTNGITDSFNSTGTTALFVRGAGTWAPSSSGDFCPMIRGNTIYVARPIIIAALQGAIDAATKRIKALEADRNNYPKRLQKYKQDVLKAVKNVKDVSALVDSTRTGQAVVTIPAALVKPADPCEAEREITAHREVIRQAEISLAQLKAYNGVASDGSQFGELRISSRDN